MKPEKLIMQGFGPYLGITEVDFTRLGENSLFLITGATGGGKTTILDGICFALFARATGGLRSWKQMRSIGAPGDTPTLVDYIFTLGDARYRFTRSQSVYAARRTGEQKIKEEHACYRMENGEWEILLSGAESKVAQCAQDLLGLDCEQFSRVIMLPQGEFRRLLLSSSADKAKIFEKLFSTQRWSRATDIITAQATALQRQMEDLTLTRRAVLEREQVENTSQLEEKEESIRLSYETALREAQRLEEAADKAEQELKAAQKITEYQTLLKQQEQALDAAKGQFMQSKTHFENAQRQAQEIPMLKELRDRLLSEIPKLESAYKSAMEAQALRKRAAALELEREQVKSMQELAQAAERQAQENTAKGEAYLEHLRREIERIPILFTKYQTLSEIAQSYQKLGELKARLDSAQKETRQEQGKWEENKINLCALKDKLEQTTRQIQENMAFMLSLTLTDGAPCPVCGSMHHPSHACRNNIGLNELQQQAQKLGTLVKNAEKAEEESKLRFLDTQARLAQIQDELSRQQAVCDGYNIYYKAFVRDHEKAKKELEEAQALQEKLPRAQKLLQQRRSEYETAQKKMEACKTQREEITRLLESLNGELRALLKYLPKDGTDPQELEARLLAAKSREKDAEDKTAALQQALAQAAQNVQLAQAKLMDAQKLLERTQIEYNTFLGEHKGTDPERLSAYSSALAQARQEQRDSLEKTGRLQQSLSSVRQSLTHLQKSDEASEKVQQSFGEAQRLSKFLSGANPGKTPIKMFVLGMMLDDIIIQANEYFSVFSNGRYSLSRILENTGGNALKGLDIEIFDAYGGSTRSVYTLSGGELFLASLSLAFGLCDVVQSYSGGVRLDSIFIDEGFGTLDRETLDTALKALDRIRSMGRLVGIISHVSELKSRIGAKIEVLPSKKGSTVKIVTPD